MAVQGKTGNGIGGQMQRLELAEFAGQWLADRTITDQLSGQVIRFEGTVDFRAGQGAWIWDEDGALVLPGQAPIRATRRYLWRAEGDEIAVFFDDGRPFHVIGSGMAPTAHHDCPPDSYDVSYDFTRWPLWSARWRVTGPRKDYISDTAYRRG